MGVGRVAVFPGGWKSLRCLMAAVHHTQQAQARGTVHKALSQAVP